METIINLIVIGNSWQGGAIGPTFAAYNIKYMYRGVAAAVRIQSYIRISLCVCFKG